MPDKASKTRPVNKDVLPANIKEIMKRLGVAIRDQRHLRNIRQVELAEMSELGETTLRALESGRDLKLSSFVCVMEALGLTDRLLESIPEGDKTMRRVQTKSATAIGAQPVTMDQFRKLIEQHPDKDIPVRTRTASKLRQEGYAIRIAEDPKTQRAIYLATTCEHARASEHVYQTRHSKLGGKTHMSIDLSVNLMTPEQRALLEAQPERVREVFNKHFEQDWNATVAAIQMSNTRDKHVIRKSSGVVRSELVYETLTEALAELGVALESKTKASEASLTDSDMDFLLGEEK